MFRKLIPLASLILIAGAGVASAADTNLTARVQTAAAKVCGPVTAYSGAGLFYPQMYKAENANCVRLVSRSAMAKIAVMNPQSDTLALK